MPTHGKSQPVRIIACAVTLSLLGAFAASADWTHWRGPNQAGASLATDLIGSWSREGENLVWRDDFVGRSTPTAVDGRICAIGRLGEGIARQEGVACWNADTGAKLWQRGYTVYHTDVPWNRVGWASLAADVDTGYVFAHTVNGLLTALDANGETVWEQFLAEDHGRLSGYGGRTHTPIVDEDRVILSVIGSNWGDHRAPRHRFYAFDKRTGEIVWVSTPSGPPAGDLNTQSTPVIAEIGGQRLMIAGAADGWIHAIQARTGTPVWKFHLSQRGLNASVAVSGNTVFASHSEENIDKGTMGRIVAIDATGSGDVTGSKELWRVDEIGAGFPSPLVQGNTVYVPDNSANLHAFDAATGAERWAHNFGTVGKSSPVWADGKIYLTEVNGNVVIIEADAEGAKTLDVEHLEMPDGRYAEIYASPVIAYGRIYFTTEEGIYCLGDRNKPFAKTTGRPTEPPDLPTGATNVIATQLQVVPAEAVIEAGRAARFEVRGFDDHGNPAPVKGVVQWSMTGLKGSSSIDGRMIPDPAAGNQAGKVVAKVGSLVGAARARVEGPLPWSEDFSSVPIGGRPNHWRPTFKGAAVQDIDGEKVLVQPKAPRGAPRAFIYIGSADMTGYTVQADIKGSKKGRRFSDLGLINSGYTLDVQGGHQRLQVRSWSPERRMAFQQDFAWELDTWYTAKMRVDYVPGSGDGEKAVIRGKVWKRGEAEPEAWTITAEDPLPIRHGSPGIYTFAPVPSYFDNIKVMVSE